MADKPEISCNKTNYSWKCIILIVIVTFILIPQLVSGGTTGTTIITGNVVHYPQALFGVNISRGTAPLVVAFSDLSTGMLVSWSWDFGDTTGSILQNPVHTFRTAGRYTVILNVTDATGFISTFSDTIIVNAPAPVPTPEIITTPTTDIGIVPNGGDDYPYKRGGSSGAGSHTAKIQKPGQRAPPIAASVITVFGPTSLANNPLSADLTDMPGVAVSWITQIENNPAPDARITTIIQQNADPLTRERFSTALQRVGKKIGSLAYVMIVQKSGITSTGPATITMNVPQNWIDRNGGLGAITIVRAAEDGTTEILSTSFDGYNSDTGYPRFMAESPQGLSTFGLIGMSASTIETVPDHGQSAPAQPHNPPDVSIITAATGLFLLLAIIGVVLGLHSRKK